MMEALMKRTVLLVLLSLAAYGAHLRINPSDIENSGVLDRGDGVSLIPAQGYALSVTKQIKGRNVPDANYDITLRSGGHTLFDSHHETSDLYFVFNDATAVGDKIDIFVQKGSFRYKITRIDALPNVVLKVLQKRALYKGSLHTTSPRPRTPVHRVTATHPTPPLPAKTKKRPHHGLLYGIKHALKEMADEFRARPSKKRETAPKRRQRPKTVEEMLGEPVYAAPQKTHPATHRAAPMSPTLPAAPTQSAVPTQSASVLAPQKVTPPAAPALPSAPRIAQALPAVPDAAHHASAMPMPPAPAASKLPALPKMPASPQEEHTQAQPLPAAPELSVHKIQTPPAGVSGAAAPAAPIPTPTAPAPTLPKPQPPTAMPMQKSAPTVTQPRYSAPSQLKQSVRHMRPKPAPEPATPPPPPIEKKSDKIIITKLIKPKEQQTPMERMHDRVIGGGYHAPRQANLKVTAYNNGHRVSAWVEVIDPKTKERVKTFYTSRGTVHLPEGTYLVRATYRTMSAKLRRNLGRIHLNEGGTIRKKIYFSDGTLLVSAKRAGMPLYVKVEVYRAGTRRRVTYDFSSPKSGIARLKLPAGRYDVVVKEHLQARRFEGVRIRGGSVRSLQALF